MTESRKIWQPRYTITPDMARWLMQIEGARAVVDRMSLTPAVASELRRRARTRSTHFSTRIEGNRLTLAEAEEAIKDSNTVFQGRERDVHEVRNYWNALLKMENWIEKKSRLTEGLIGRLHALVEYGPRARPTQYRDRQNVIRDATSGAIVYMPPEAHDVPDLMAGLVVWAKRAEKENIPVPLIAGLFHYQFVTIHPYYDGNGRTARLLATFILNRGGYGLNGFFSLEEHHSRDLAGYYRALAVHPHHNYYEGREEADISPWVGYFLKTLANVFASAGEETLRHSEEGFPIEPKALRELDHRGRIVLGLFARTNKITTSQVARELGLSDRMARVLLKDWVNDGWLEVASASKRTRSYSLSAIYRQFIGSLSATTS